MLSNISFSVNNKGIWRIIKQLLHGLNLVDNQSIWKQ